MKFDVRTGRDRDREKSRVKIVNSRFPGVPDIMPDPANCFTFCGNAMLFSLFFFSSLTQIVFQIFKYKRLVSILKVKSINWFSHLVDSEAF